MRRLSLLVLSLLFAWEAEASLFHRGLNAGSMEYRAIARAGQSACILKTDGAVYCWGWNSYGEVGDGSFTQRNTPQGPIVTDAISVVGGAANFCALLRDHTVKCWGRNNYGQLGNGGNTNSNVPVTANFNVPVRSLSLGQDYGCAVLVDGTIKCWGRNNSRQLGNGSSTDSNVPVAVTGLTDAITVEAGQDHTCAITFQSDNYGGVKCWGNRGGGALGDGSSVGYAATPVNVWGMGRIDTSGGATANGPYAADLATGQNWTCAVSADGRLYCWGANSQCQMAQNLGFPGSVVATLSPAFAAGSLTDVEANRDSICGWRRGGALKCWGANSATGPNFLWDSGAGLVCNSTTFTPASVSGMTNVKDFDMPPYFSVSAFFSALSTNGTLFGWGYGTHGELGNGSTSNVTTPTASGITGVAEGMMISGGERHECHINTTGNAYCVGEGANGKLGNGSTSDAASPVAVTGLSGITLAIAAGSQHSCAVVWNSTLSKQEVRCWGANNYGQLGNGTTTGSSTPVTASLSGSGGDANPIAVTAGRDHSCALMVSGKVQCWGSNIYGQVGDGTNTAKSTPVFVELAGGTAFSGGTTLQARGDFTCASTHKGNVFCWGRNSWGQLGNGTTLHSNVAGYVLKDDGNVVIRAMSVGISWFSGCYHGANGHYACWGKNKYSTGGPNDNLLGYGSTASYVTSVVIGGTVAIPAGETRLTSLVLGHDRNFARGNTSKMYFWGRTADTIAPNTPCMATSVESIGSPTVVTEADGVTPVRPWFIASAPWATYLLFGASTDPIKSCGTNTWGTLGTGNFTSYNTPTASMAGAYP